MLYFFNDAATPEIYTYYTLFPYTTLCRSTGQNIVLIQRRLAEPGPRQFFQETDTWQGTFGLRGKLSNDWGWEVAGAFGRNTAEIGRASCRESVCQYVEILVVAVSLKTKIKKQ